MSRETATLEAPAETAEAAPKVKWGDSKMQTTYANVVNATLTREEISVFFGTNHTWNLGASREFDIELTDRIVLNPYTAKRLSFLLGRILHEYERRFGTLSLDGFVASENGS